jgi:hypothetical protein
MGRLLRILNRQDPATFRHTDGRARTLERRFSIVNRPLRVEQNNFRREEKLPEAPCVIG